MAVTKPLWVQTASHTAQDVRNAMMAMLGAPSTDLRRPAGVVPGYGGSLAVTQTGVASMQVQIAAGVAVIRGNTSGQGSYLFANDATTNLTIGTAPGSGTRIDSIIARVRDSSFGDASDTATLEVIVGTVGAGAPALPAGSNSIRLADITVGPTVTSINSGNIADKRVWTAAPGGLLVTPSTALPATPYNGLPIVEEDTGRVTVYNGSAAAYRPLAHTGGSSALGKIARARTAAGTPTVLLNVAATNTKTDIPGMTVTFNAELGRLYGLRATAYMSQPQDSRLFFSTSANVDLHQVAWKNVNVGTLDAGFRYTGTGASTTIKLRLMAASIAGSFFNAEITTDVDRPCELFVEDLGIA